MSPDHLPTKDDRPFSDLPVVKALFTGALVGALQVALFYGLSGEFVGRPVGEPEHNAVENLLISWPIIALVFPVAYVAWLIGLIFVGTPGWWLLHRLRLRGLEIAAPYGFALTFLAGLLLSGGRAFPTHFLFATAGAGVAVVVWFLAYRTKREGAAA